MSTRGSVMGDMVKAAKAKAAGHSEEAEVHSRIDDLYARIDKLENVLCDLSTADDGYKPITGNLLKKCLKEADDGK